MSTKEERAEAAADARADAKADAAEARASDRAEARAGNRDVAGKAGYVTIEGGQFRRRGEESLDVEILSGFIAPGSRPVDKGDRLRLPKSVALEHIAIGNARLVAAEDVPPAPSAPETVQVRDPAPRTHDPKVRKR
jgi:hypothetical protein